MRRASFCLERRGETDREREAREEEDSSMEDWAERTAKAAVRRWAGEHNFIKSGSSFWAKPGENKGRADLIKVIITAIKVAGAHRTSISPDDSAALSALFPTSLAAVGLVTPSGGLKEKFRLAQ